MVWRVPATGTITSSICFGTGSDRGSTFSCSGTSVGGDVGTTTTNVTSGKVITKSDIDIEEINIFTLNFVLFCIKYHNIINGSID